MLAPTACDRVRRKSWVFCWVAEPGRATMARWFVHSIGGPRRSRGLLTGHRRHSGPVCRVRNDLDERAVKPVHV